MYWKETVLGMEELLGCSIMNIDDLMPFMLSSTIGRNKNKISGDVISTIINGTKELVDELNKYNVNIYMTGGETADVGDLVRTIIVDSTVVARIKKDEVIDNSKISTGNVIVGLASYGQSTYESNYNSGMGSNGLTSARHDVFSKILILIMIKLVYAG